MAAPDTTTQGLCAVGLGKTIKDRLIVRGVNLRLQRGEIVGLLGANGAGKTTVFSMIIGLLSIDSGRLILDGEDISDLPIYRRARKGIGYLPQESSVFRRLSVEKNLRLVLETLRLGRSCITERVNRLLEDFDIAKLRHDYPATLSGGERRRVEIARAIAVKPKFLLLDEPFAGVDPLAVHEVRSLTRRLADDEMGILITDHNVRETLKLIDRAVILHDGRVLAEGSPAEILENDHAREYYLGDDFTL